MDERNFRAIARERLRGSWAVSIGVAAVACLLGGLLTGSSFLPKVESELGMAVPFLMADFPELTASEAIRRSKELMDGHKGDLFVLNLSFLGWDLLCMLTLNIGNLWLNPYKNAAHAAFYRQLLAEQQYTTVE